MNRAERMKRLQELFNASLERPRQERAAFLQAACADDTDLQQEVETLLLAHESSDGFLEAPPHEQITALLDDPATTIQAPLPSGAFSHYEIISLLGKGGMGEVYLASDAKLGRKAALKILPPRYTTNPDLVNRFEREAKAASALNHPNILTVYEIGQTENSHFIATEYIAGETLRQRLTRGLIPLPEALEIALQIAAALNAAHEVGIIHRDIKPENIMLRPDGYVKVLDFGLAKLTQATNREDESSTQTGLIMGTPSYMSPEQARGQKVDARTDIWSLGVVLYEMARGARPFSGDSQADLMVAILEREPVSLPAHLPPELNTIVQRALAKDPPQRYTTSKEFYEALKALRRKVEFASELKHITQAERADAKTMLYSLAAVTTVVEADADAAIVAVPQTVEKASSRFPLRVTVASIALASALGIAAWYYFHPTRPIPPAPVQPATAPKRELTWWLTVQRKLEATPFQSAGRDWFPNGSKFKFNLTSPQDGYLYLLNEGPTTGGKVSLNLLYPTPANNNRNAAVTANQPIQTGNYDFDDNQGEEKFWIIWAAHPVPEIEAVKAAATPAINSPTEAILSFLNKYASQSEAKTDETTEQTKVGGGDVIVSLVKLKHR